MSTSEGQATVMIVDDEEMVATALASLLELDTPYRALPYTSPARALGAIEDGEAVHVVIADFMMPGMDGITFLSQVREKRPTATRIMLTGYADKANAIRGINEAGLYQYLEKPWNNEHMKLVIRNGIERARILHDLEAHIRELENVNQELYEMRRRLMRAFL
jgi:DNA-binding NtrC family response regulator